MVDQVARFLAQDLNRLAAESQDISEHRLAVLKQEMNRCAKDTEFDLSERDTESDNFPYFALCLKNAVAINTVLNQSNTITRQVNNWHFH